MQRSFKFYPSHSLLLLFVSAHAVAVWALCFVPIPKLALCFLLPILVASMVYYAQRDARLRLQDSWSALRLTNEYIVLSNRRGDEFAGTLLRSSVVTPYLVVLRVKLTAGGGNANVVLLPDSMDTESWRRLCVVLKWGIQVIP